MAGGGAGASRGQLEGANEVPAEQQQGQGHTHVPAEQQQGQGQTHVPADQQQLPDASLHGEGLEDTPHLPGPTDAYSFPGLTDPALLLGAIRDKVGRVAAVVGDAMRSALAAPRLGEGGQGQPARAASGAGLRSQAFILTDLAAKWARLREHVGSKFKGAMRAV